MYTSTEILFLKFHQIHSLQFRFVRLFRSLKTLSICVHKFLTQTTRLSFTIPQTQLVPFLINMSVVFLHPHRSSAIAAEHQFKKNFLQSSNTLNVRLIELRSLILRFHVELIFVFIYTIKSYGNNNGVQMLMDA